jgi:glycerol kinase
MAAESGKPLAGLRVDGGASANGFLMQFQADMLAATVDRPVIIETTALGAALLAALGTGLLSEPGDARRLLAAPTRVLPGLAPGERAARRASWQRTLERLE